jgi:cytochrome P450
VLGNALDVDPATIHLKAEQWAREFGEAYRPERWLSGASASSTKRVAMPFGAGPRMCPGRYLALAEIKMVMAMLLASFDIERVSSPDGEDVRERLALTMSPAGLEMYLRRRAVPSA